MATAIKTRRKTTVEHAPGRVITTTRRKARLTLSIGGVDYRLRPFDDDPDGRSGVEWIHTLIPSDGEPFAVLITNAYFVNGRWQDHPIPGSKFHCDACDAGDCPHIAALDAVGLF
jgi:hypothetical protein